MTDCPHCGKPLPLEIVAKLTKESSFQLSISPAPGQLMNAKGVGGSIAAVGNLIKAIGREMKVPTEVLVEKIETDDSGKITVSVLIARFDHPLAVAARNGRKKRQQAPSHTNAEA